MKHLPRALLVIAAVNFAAALFFLAALPAQDGGRVIACIGLVVVHLLIGGGLLLRMNWARALMLVYALFQIAALATAAVVAILSLQLKPFTAWTATILVLTLVLIPFLVWGSRYLLRETTRALFVPPET